MAGLKQIVRRLGSVKNTKKITYAMKLVSAAKLRKAQEAVTRTREYSSALNKLLDELLLEQAGSDISHPLLMSRSQVKRARLLILGGNRGLCGGYNTNINRRVEALYREKGAQGIQLDSTILCKKPAEYFRRIQRSYLEALEDLPDDANLWPIDQVCSSLEQDFIEGKTDEVYMVYTKFRSAISMSVIVEKILPLHTATVGTVQTEAGLGHGNSSSSSNVAVSGVTLFEPSASQVFSALIPRILRAKVRQAALDAKASEHGSRMTAMEAATKNAGDLIRKLTLTSNRLRQSGVTSQLLDILGGSQPTE